MAAGDVIIVGDVIPDVGGKAGPVRLLWGTVQADGGNPTPIALANYVKTVDFCVASIIADAPTADDPNLVCVGALAATDTTINIEIYKNVSGTDPTYADSTLNTVLISWFAVGPVL